MPAIRNKCCNVTLYIFMLLAIKELKKQLPRFLLKIKCLEINRNDKKIKYNRAFSRRWVHCTRAYFLFAPSVSLSRSAYLSQKKK